MLTNHEKNLLFSIIKQAVVSIHASLTDEAPWPSFHMLDAVALDRLPPGALLINAGRGELLATDALLTLGSRRPDLELVLDVWENEPSIDATLLSRARFGTAHIAGYSHDGKRRATGMLYREACRALGRPSRPDAPGGDGVVVEAPRLQGPELLRWLVQRVYDIREDDSLLRQAMPDGFDRLRKTYRRRRELSSLAIANSRELDTGQRELCAALGCKL